MKVIIQRSKNASVIVRGEVVGQIDHGLVALVGISESDTEEDVKKIVQKMISLRIFADEEDKMNLSIQETGGSILSISQFTLYADVRKGRRPNFTKAAEPRKAEHLYNLFNKLIQEEAISVQTGLFGEMMEVELINDGPVTLILETEAGKLIE